MSLGSASITGATKPTDVTRASMNVVAADSNDRIIVADFNEGTVQIFDSNGLFLDVIDGDDGANDADPADGTQFVNIIFGKYIHSYEKYFLI